MGGEKDRGNNTCWFLGALPGIKRIVNGGPLHWWSEKVFGQKGHWKFGYRKKPAMSRWEGREEGGVPWSHNWEGQVRYHFNQSRRQSYGRDLAKGRDRIYSTHSKGHSACCETPKVCIWVGKMEAWLWLEAKDRCKRWTRDVMRRMESTQGKDALWGDRGTLGHNDLSLHAYCHYAGMSWWGVYAAWWLPVPTGRKD